ncbi:MAG: Mth938-like domain-containing protein [Thermodesulfovibrionales bacterium]
MRIDHYSFGRITINGRSYTSDVIIYPERVDSSWWRKEGHLLQPDDLVEIIAAKPDILIVGTGFSGVMEVPKETIDYINRKGIVVYIEKTSKAVELFNRLKKEKTGKIIIAALHLTC